MYKYRILYLLRQLSYEDYQISWEFFPQVLNISKATWKRWIYIKKKDSMNIPSYALPKIAIFFDCSIDDLFNANGTEIKERIDAIFKKMKDENNKL